MTGTKERREGSRPSPTACALLAVLAAVLVLPLALAARADAYVYWTNDVRAPMAL
jgi:hypothetical protein